MKPISIYEAYDLCERGSGVSLEGGKFVCTECENIIADMIVRETTRVDCHYEMEDGVLTKVQDGRRVFIEYRCRRCDDKWLTGDGTFAYELRYLTKMIEHNLSGNELTVEESD